MADIQTLSELDFKILVGQGACVVGNFVYNNPQILYKGMPILLAVYTFYPLIAFSWKIVPMAMAAYDIYNRIPSGTIPVTLGMAKNFLLKK